MGFEANMRPFGEAGSPYYAAKVSVVDRIVEGWESCVCRLILRPAQEVEEVEEGGAGTRVPKGMAV